MKKVKYILKEHKRPTGRWNWNLADNGWADTTCSNCGFTSNNDIHVKAFYPYCPNCGAFMVNGKKEIQYEREGEILK